MTTPRRVLLIDPPYLGDKIGWWDQVGSHMPGLGLPTLAAWLERCGHHVRIVDGHAQGLSATQPDLPVLGFEPDIVGITAMTPVVPYALNVARACKARFPDAPVVLGGAHATVLPEDLLASPFVDFAVRGEGEQTLEQLVEGADPATIDGLSWIDGDRTVHNPDRALLEDLDDLPSPAWHLLPMDRYRPGLGTYRQLPAMSLMSGRGCPNRCTYCFNLFGRRVRRQSPARVVREIHQLSQSWGVRQIQFYDDTFTLQAAWLRDFCQRLRRDAPRISWTCYGRVDRVDAESLADMASAGCHQICLGVESGDPGTLTTIDKHIEAEQVRRAVRLTREAGIEPRGTFMFGNQGETAASMQATLDLALELDLDVALFSVATAYPGTEFFRWAEAEGHLVTRDWALYDRNSTTVRLPTVDPEVVWDFHRRGYREFYLRPGFVLRRCLRLKNLRHLQDAARVLTEVARYR